MPPLCLSIRLARPGYDRLAPDPSGRWRASNDNHDCFEQFVFDRAVTRELITDEMPE